MSAGLQTRPGPDERPVLGGGRWRGLRGLVVRIHFYAGLLVGPFLLVAAVTGLLYTITPQLERWVHADALTAPVSGPPRPVAEQVAAAVATQPGLPVTEVRPSPAPGSTTRVVFDAGLPESYARTVFVDPATARITATEVTYTEWLPVRGVLDNLHRSLLLGPPGQVYTELAASWLAVLTTSGLLVQLTRRVRRRRERVVPRRGGPGRARLRSWHGAVGLWASTGLLFLSATGLTWSQFAGANVTSLRQALDWTTPSVSSTLPTPQSPASAVVDADAVPGIVQRVLDAARADGLGGPVEVVPGDPGEAWRVQQTGRSWPTAQDAVAVAPDSGEITDRLAFADWPVAAKLARWGVDAHMGLLFGVVNQLALAALACGLIVLVVWGYRMWWLRRPRGVWPPVPPGGRERPSTASVALVGGVGVVAGLVLPVLGVSLILFLLLDAVLAARGRQPRDRPDPQRPRV